MVEPFRVVLLLCIWREKPEREKYYLCYVINHVRTSEVLTAALFGLLNSIFPLQESLLQFVPPIP